MEIKGVGLQWNQLGKETNEREVVRPAFEASVKMMTDDEKRSKGNGRESQPIVSLAKNVDSMNDLLEATPTSVKFQFHAELDRTYVQLVSQETDEVIREIPPEEFLNMVAMMLKNAGLIVDERV